MTSLCVECDAEPGGCDHIGPRYLEPIAYEPVIVNERRVGWRVPDHEQERWANIIRAAPPAPTPHDARPIQRLIVELEDLMVLDEHVENELRAAYERDAARITRLVAYIVDQTRIGTVRNPSGLLLSRLRAA